MSSLGLSPVAEKVTFLSLAASSSAGLTVNDTPEGVAGELAGAAGEEQPSTASRIMLSPNAISNCLFFIQLLLLLPLFTSRHHPRLHRFPLPPWWFFE
jgi:hypothetical protein